MFNGPPASARAKRSNRRILRIASLAIGTRFSPCGGRLGSPSGEYNRTIHARIGLTNEYRLVRSPKSGHSTQRWDTWDRIRFVFSTHPSSLVGCGMFCQFNTYVVLMLANFATIPPVAKFLWLPATVTDAPFPVSAARRRRPPSVGALGMQRR